MNHDTEIVPAVRRALAERVGADRYDLWFASSTRFRIQGDRLIVGVSTAFLQDWLRSNFRTPLEETARETLGASASVTFEIDPTLGARRNDANGGSDNSATPTTGGDAIAGNMAVNKPATTATVDGSSVTLHGATSLSSTSASSPSSRPTAPPRRVIAPRKVGTFDEFVVGPSNRLACASAMGVVERPGEISPLVLYGPTGVGKTHLLEAIAEAARRRGPEIQTAHLSAEQFTTSFLEGLHGGGLPNFRRKFRGLHILLVDDVQFFAGKRATLVEFVHTLDTLQREGKQIVLAADRAPAELGVLGPELRSRMTGGLIVELQPPEMSTRVGIVGGMATKLGLTLQSDVREFVAAHFTAHARELSGALKRLFAVSSAYGRPIDCELAEEALGELIRSRQKTVRLVDIEKAVCDVFGLEADTLQSERKARDVSHPRMLAMWLARKYTRAALSEIGRYFGNRSHSTVISAQRKVADWISDGEPLQTTGGRVRFEEALRRIEQTLQSATN